MKLKTKLIPLATVAATSIIVAPTVLTSCGNGSIKLKDITKEFTPDFDQYAANPMLSQYGATNEYVNFVKNQKADFQQDIAYGIRENWVNLFNSIYTWSSEPTEDEYSIFTNAKLTSIEFGIQNVKFGTKTIRFPGEQPLDYPTVSFTMKTVLQFELDGKEEMYDYEYAEYVSHQYTDLYTVENTTTYNDMLFFAIRGNPLGLHAAPGNAGTQQKTQDSWHISFFDNGANEALNVATDWSISTKSKITIDKTDKVSGRKSSQTKETNTIEMLVDDADTLGNKLFSTITYTLDEISDDKNYEAFDALSGQQGNLFFTTFAAMFLYRSYYLGNTLEAPYIQPAEQLSNEYSRLLDTSGYLEPEAYDLHLFDSGDIDTSLNGWDYIAPYSKDSESIQTQYDIGNITLLEDEDLFLPEVYNITKDHPRYLHIPYNASLFDVDDYDKSAQDWQKEMNRCIRLEAQIVEVEFDEYGKPIMDSIVPSGYTVEELDYAKAHDLFVDGAIQFKFPKRQLKTQTEIYDMATSQLIQTNIGIIDLRPINGSIHLWGEQDTTLVNVYYDWE